MKIKKVIGNLYESNTYIIYEENIQKSIVIDPSNINQISNIIKANKLSLEYIILTHEHYDHIYGLNKLRNLYNFKVVSSEGCNYGIQNSKINLSKYFNVILSYKYNTNNMVNYEYVCKESDITFSGFMELNWNDHLFKFYETPGHSVGSVSILLDDRYLFSGDSLLYNVEVVTKFPGGNKEDYKTITLNFYKELNKNIKVYPGHGESFFLYEKTYF